MDSPETISDPGKGGIFVARFSCFYRTRPPLPDGISVTQSTKNHPIAARFLGGIKRLVGPVNRITQRL